MTDNILEVRNLSTHFFTRAGTIKAADDVSFSIKLGSTLALVGESGSGKSVTSLSIMRLVRAPGKIFTGEIIFDGRDVMNLDEREMRRIRGREIAMIFQDPMTSLNPVYTVGDQIAEAILLHEGVSRKQAWAKTVEMMKRVKIPDAERRAKDYPHQLSGGMRQRVMIAMALACNPKLLIADEPTTALDVTIQQQILELLLDLREELGMAIVIITHNMGVVAEMADRVLVMYAGRIVERAPVTELFERPAHPYTRGLLESIPTLADERDRLKTIPGMLPNPAALPPGCRFEPRCQWRIAECTAAVPSLMPLREEHESACIRQHELVPQ